jgi:hypothetical protein
MVAWDPNGRQSVRNVSFQVYAITDTSYTTPLAITDPFGTALPGNILNSGSQGVFPQFKQATNSSVVIADATKTFAWTVPCVLQDTAVAGFAADPTSALAGQLNATYAPVNAVQKIDASGNVTPATWAVKLDANGDVDQLILNGVSL